MPSPFEIASAVERIEPGVFRANVPDGWQQGRGAFGGLVLGTLLRAIEASEDDRARAVRTLTGDIAGPVLAGPAEIRVDVVRRGSNQSNIRAELRQNGEALAFATAVLSTPRPSAVPHVRPRLLGLARAEDVPIAPIHAPHAPVFAAHYAFRPTGPKLYAGGGDPATAGFIREKVAPSTVDAPALVALLDSWWPAFFSTTTAFRPMATVSFTAEITCDPRTLDPTASLAYRARTLAEHDGFQVELRELYDSRGEVVALNQQTFAVLK